ncbi:hypothetical protein ASE04_27560 [Rhizobium sp. Root708]|nr:hypothetical protein ASE04_27560 [Rhizobium sp. Root708]
MATLSVLIALASSCSPIDRPAPPVVSTRFVKTELPPEAREETPALSPKPDRDLPQEELFNNWSSDRTARNIGELRRKACVAAVDATPTSERLGVK